MARIGALLLLTAVLLAALACGGDDDSSSSSTATRSASSTASASSSASPAETTAAAEQWSGDLTGPLAGAFTNTLPPQCGATEGQIAVSIQGLVNGHAVVVTIVSQGPGTFDIKTPSDETPTIDVGTSGEIPTEWFAAAGTTGEGDLTLKADGSGSAAVTLPAITTGDQPPIGLTASWDCPAATPAS